MSEHEHNRHPEMDPVVGAWHGWASVDLVRLAFK